MRVKRAERIPCMHTLFLNLVFEGRLKLNKKKQFLRCKTSDIDVSLIESSSTSNEGGKFLKKLWCCVGGRVQQGNLVLSTELKT